MSLPPPVLALSLVHCNTNCRLCFMKHCLSWPPPGFPHCAQVLCKTWKDAGQNYLQPSSSLPQRFCSATALLGELPFSVSPETQPSSGCASKERGGCLKQSGGAAFNFPFLRGKAAEAYGGCSGALPQQGPAGLFASPPAGAGGEAERGRPRVRSRLLLLRTAAPKAKSRDVDFSKAGRGF